jgi:hypothetical protein
MLVLLLATVSFGCSLRRSQAASSRLSAATVSYCDLLDDADHYDGALVRVRGVYSTDFEASELGSPECGDLRFLSTWVDFDSDYERLSERKWRKELAQVKWRQPVDVVFVGRFEAKRENANRPGQGFGHMDMYVWRLVVISVEQVRPLGTFQPLPQSEK